MSECKKRDEKKGAGNVLWLFVPTEKPDTAAHLGQIKHMEKIHQMKIKEVLHHQKINIWLVFQNFYF